ncbi:GNAT family N-acetyltransferase [Cohnella yongneupensis]|uniref:GNAT family N-acetyltransferase n=1 Tax=Cohnella yongneupensis TaxID=425006 RepID=A0ABW0QYX4_9BACL
MNFEPCLMDDVQQLMQDYLRGLSSPFDSFLEEHIVSSAFYRITEEPGEMGYFAIHENGLLTQFYIRHALQMHAQTLFDRVIEQYAVKSLFIPTGDELFVSLALDKSYVVNKQAYFFQDSGTYTSGSRVRDNETFRLAVLDDLEQIQRVCGDFLDAYERRITSGELFVYYREADLLGIGIAERSKLLPGLASIGMFANEAFRRQGVGTTIIEALRQWCAQHGIRPISGCWYYNDGSKKTLEKAGMVSRTRLLNITTHLG